MKTESQLEQPPLIPFKALFDYWWSKPQIKDQPSFSGTSEQAEKITRVNLIRLAIFSATLAADLWLLLPPKP